MCLTGCGHVGSTHEGGHLLKRSRNVQVFLLSVLLQLMCGCSRNDRSLPASGRYLIYREVVDSPAFQSRTEAVYSVKAVRDDGAAVVITSTREPITCVVLGASNQSAASARAAMRETSLLPTRSTSYSGPDLPTDSITFGVEGDTRTWQVNVNSFTEAGLRTDEFEEYRDFVSAFIGVRLYINDATRIAIVGRPSFFLQANYDLLPLVGELWDPDKAIGVLESLMPRKVQIGK